MTDATPGPWRAAALLAGSLGERPQSYLIESLNGLHIAEAPAGYSANRDERVTHRANARLLAAAPALRDGCNALLGLLQLICARDDVPAAIRHILMDNHRVDEARAAIAKAEGADQ